MKTYIQIHTEDNVAIALEDIAKGSELVIQEERITVLEPIMKGHKIALKALQEDENIIKYGAPIGHASCAIEKGAWIHTHNIKTNLGEVLEYSYKPEEQLLTQIKQDAYFEGYRRANGKVGVRNEVWIIPTVGCVNNVVQLIEKKAQALKVEGIEEIVAFTHPYGCSQMGDDQENTRRILADLITHPNAGGVLVVGLGCENTGVEELKKLVGDYDATRIQFMVAQSYEDELEEALRRIEQIVGCVKKDKRQKISASELVIGMKCGGSDGLSGITANPLVGVFSDELIKQGGTTILTEVPEMFGAETLLMNRCENEALFNQTVHLINDFKNYFIAHNQTIYENPSPGNKKGGISTLEDKSLGCTQKSGSAQVSGVLDYGDKIQQKGLNLLNAPGNDLVASTALAAAGAHIVLFTTGRGTPFASPVPTVKISSNSELGNYKKNWIDFDAGILTKDANIDEVGKLFFDYILAVASGQKVKAEEAGFHDMAIFKQGITL